MRSVLQRASRDVAPPHGKFVKRARAALRRLRPVAFAYFAERTYGG
jgi:hypothetical protein